MKKFYLFAFVVICFVLYAGNTGYGIRIGQFTFAFAPDRQAVYDATQQFLEDLQFKDFSHAESYHDEEDRKKKDIAKLIEEKFFVKPELLDIRHFEILNVKISSTGNRARVATKTTAKVLNSEQARGKDDVRSIDTLWYWKKVGDRWYMDLSSSL